MDYQILYGRSHADPDDVGMELRCVRDGLSHLVTGQVAKRGRLCPDDARTWPTPHDGHGQRRQNFRRAAVKEMLRVIGTADSKCLFHQVRSIYTVLDVEPRMAGDPNQRHSIRQICPVGVERPG